MPGEVKSFQHLDLQALDVEAEKVDGADASLVEQGGERPRWNLDLVGRVPAEVDL